MDKNTCRQYWLEKRKTFQPEKIQAFQEALIDFLSNLEAQTIFSYFSIKDELPTRQAIYANWQRHRILIPRTNPQDRSMETCPIRSKEDLVDGPFHLIEAKTPAYDGKIDLCLVPGLVFDRQGFRIGYGGGYYDRFLKDHPCYCIGLCLEEQIVPDLKPAPYDMPVQALFTEQGLRQI
ncbi:5-formyltetrahydrofolate cyclo-ligase family protein [Urinicoccus massiliensis]|uniref:5-formyltetrahydrofolate cyclo-ligase n=1 Tax=Urinicoccus massiliensis TaxID=1723382 RepID=A0A8H2QSQ9_9FIRM|nr:5-formyltetrahydrofolate cyclo-ligase [Urinicoccus massiliensis]VFB16135.1 5-formyltetrahydrofolate cyclo-ligase family protein [Urinicoccus massiliensis]